MIARRERRRKGRVESRGGGLARGVSVNSADVNKVVVVVVVVVDILAT